MLEVEPNLKTEREKMMVHMVSRIMAPKEVHILTPETCEYVTLHKRDVVDVIE